MFPVITLDGGSHMSFFSGEPPLFVKLNDLRAEVAEDVAHQFFAKTIITFIKECVSGKRNLYADASTKTLIAPL
jgi:hypothetical protein